MRYSLIIGLLLSISFFATAQELKHEGKNIGDIIPDDWEIFSCDTGDLNKDGLDDLAFIVRQHKENLIEISLDCGDTILIDENKFIVAIYWGKANGYFTHYKDWDDLVWPESSTASYEELWVKITDKGTLKFRVKMFLSAGGWTNPNYTVTYRFQNGNFYRIGYDSDEYSRATMEGEKISINYSTGKRYIVKYNASDLSESPGYWESFKEDLKEIDKGF